MQTYIVVITTLTFMAAVAALYFGYQNGRAIKNAEGSINRKIDTNQTSIDNSFSEVASQKFVDKSFQNIVSQIDSLNNDIRTELQTMHTSLIKNTTETTNRIHTDVINLTEELDSSIHKQIESLNKQVESLKSIHEERHKKVDEHFAATKRDILEIHNAMSQSEKNTSEHLKYILNELHVTLTNAQSEHITAVNEIKKELRSIIEEIKSPLSID